ncbi:hypothetical protein [Solidesulfovibrio sp.]|uniref:hypothetical protein n=1 Tax=Solidesulfovibrio sp. TaxID=2910990 RepID=UPI002B203568|nr:hypothetical protein [Solidesulfovibrio sp.]MEA5089608.1 hypothetical protein [Solidesulfovibrio sp.]HML54580.1 hypothetical protein [Solidesulfovibrio magneticus]
MRKSNLLPCQILFVFFLILSSWLQQSIAKEIKKSSTQPDNKEPFLIVKEELSTLRNEYDNKISKLEKELADLKRKGEHLEEAISKNQKDFYGELISTVNMFSNAGNRTLAILGAFIAVMAFLGYKKLNDLVHDAMRPVNKKIDNVECEHDDSKRWHDEAKVEYKELKDKLKKDKSTIEKLTNETKAQIEYMQGIDILRNTSTGEKSILRAIELLKSSISSHSYDITRVSLAAAYKYTGDFRAACFELHKLSEPDKLSSEGAAALLEIAILVNNQEEFERVDSQYKYILKEFDNELFLPLMKSVMAFVQGNVEEMDRYLKKCQRKIQLYDDKLIDEKIENGKKCLHGI